MYNKWKKKTRREIDFTGADDNAQNRPNPNFKYNTKVPNELRSAQQIKVIRKERDKSKLKNMTKDKRNSLLKKNKAKKPNEVRVGTKAGNRKVKIVVRR
jgi:hypothetical protein